MKGLFRNIQPSPRMQERLQKIISHYGFDHQLGKLREEFAEMCLELQRMGGDKGDYDKMLEEVADFHVVRNQFISQTMTEEQKRLVDTWLSRMQSAMDNLDYTHYLGCVINNRHAKQKVMDIMTSKVWRTLDRMPDESAGQKDGWS